MAQRIVIVLAALIVLLAFLYVYMKWEFTNIKVTKVPLNMQGGPSIVYVADFQYDMTPNNKDALRGGTFQKAVDLINAQGADIILLGGDYNTYPSNWEAAVPYLRQLHAPLGVYAVFGNHDIQARMEYIQALPNIRFLQNEAVDIAYGGKTICVYGVEDLWTGEPHVDAAAIHGDYNILLTHNPDFFDNMAENPFDITLSGHIHAGQFTLFGVGIPTVLRTVTDHGDKYRYGDKVYNGHRIYITSGLGGGIMALPLRFCARPEIVLLQ